MNRREFLMCSSAAAAVAAGSGVLVAPKAANAEPITLATVSATLATVSAAFNLASGIAGFLSRDANPTVPWLISLGKAVDALNIKIDAIDHTLDLMLAELFKIRQLVEKLPYENQLLGLGIAMREPYAAFLELKPETQSESPSEAYLRAIPKIRDRMRTTRIRYLDLARQERAPAFEAVLQLALAQDAELILAAEMQRPEMYALGLEEDIKGTLGALEAYASFFDAAVDPETPGSMTAVKAALALDVERRLGEIFGRQKWKTGPSTSSISTTRDIFEKGHTMYKCGHSVHYETVPWQLRLPRAISYQDYLEKRNNQANAERELGLLNTPLEPQYKVYSPYYGRLNVKRTAIPQTVTDVHDRLGYPYLHEISSPEISSLECGAPLVLASSLLASSLKPFERSASDVNAAVARYYQVHYAHGVCALAQTINARQQRILRGLL